MPAASDAPPVATIVIPAFGAERFIAAAVASACAQTEPRVEVLVVDDCSTDSTAAVIQAMAARDPRVRLLRTPQNGGPAVARNLGFADARGEWIAILDADDTFEPERIERLTTLGHRHGADMCADNLLRVFEEEGRAPEILIPKERLSAERRLSFADFVEGNLIRSRARVSYGFLQPIFRRSFLEAHGLRYAQDLRFGEDFMLYVQCLRAGAVWWLTPEPMYRYLIRRGTLTEVQTARDLKRIREFDRQLLADPEIARDPRLAGAVRRHLTRVERNFYYRAWTDAVKARAWREACRLPFDSGRAAPLIVQEALRQAPTILAKAVKGGYRPRQA